MAAEVVSRAGHSVTLFEKRKAPGRKLLIAGSSGLNITNHLPISELSQHYTGSHGFWRNLFEQFSPQDWIHFIESLGIETFLGTSGRYFVKEMKASKFLRAWLNHLNERNVRFFMNHELVDFNLDPSSSRVILQFTPDQKFEFDALCLCLGGGSYESSEVPLRWPQLLLKKNLGFTDFTPSNVGYRVDWKAEFLKEAEGLPLKNIELTSSRGVRKGDGVITSYGLEGTPVYFVGEPGVVFLDLKPDLTESQILSKCRAVKENYSPFRRIKKQLNLCPAALALIFHHTPANLFKDLQLLVKRIKKFPISFQGSQALTESISSAGGLHLDELNPNWMLKKYPGVFAAGEMLDWDAPTGGFLIQASVSQGYSAGQGILNYLNR
jgi:uncharacterized flavoprotein (TIGR03862 family)